MIEAGIAGRLCWPLVDSGADFSMMSTALYSDIQDGMGGHLTGKGPTPGSGARLGRG